KIQPGIKLKGQEFKGLRKHFYYWTLKQAGKYDPENPPSGIGAFIYRIADKTVYSSIRELFGGNLRGMISGGAALSPDLFRFINAMGVYCGQGYGLTETSPVVAVQNRELMRIGSCGKALTDVKIKIAGDNEILVRGPNVMKGYYGDPIRTGEVITEDGWFKTGDVGRMDSDGYLFITDRKKALFKLSTGKYIAPQHVESQLESSGYIEQAVVIGYQKKFCSALIVPAYANVRKRLGREGHVPDEPPNDDRDVRELIQAEVEKVNENLSPWEKVKKFTLLERPLSIESGELTPTLKIKKAVVSEKYRKEIEAMYEE
ncbi:MAG: AMP-binding protein, partial [Balneolaceae bacterium]